MGVDRAALHHRGRKSPGRRRLALGLMSFVALAVALPSGLVSPPPVELATPPVGLAKVPGELAEVPVEPREFIESNQSVELTKLYGTVSTPDGDPVRDCYVGVSDQDYRELAHVTTDARGRYEIDVPHGPLYRLWIGKLIGGRYDHIPQRAEAKAGPVDFVLPAGGNIAITARDGEGRRLSNSEFRRTTALKVFLSDMNDMPREGYLGVVDWPDAAVHAGAGWDDAQPAFIAPPGQRYKLHVQWELPGVGKLLYTLDNAGSGYELKHAGARLDLDLLVEIARSSLASLKRAAGDDSLDGQLVRSEALLRSGSALVARGGEAAQQGMRELTSVVQTSLEVHERILLARARENIERHRMGEVEIQLVDEDGAPLRGARVSYSQTGRDFLFGANPLGLAGRFDPDVAKLMQRAGVNQSHVTARWGLLEGAPGEFDWHNVQDFQEVEAQLAAGLQLMGALSLWFSPNPDFRPEYLRAMSFPRMRDATYRYGFELAKKFRGRIDVWEVNELNLASANALELDVASRIELGRTFARAVKDANPQALIVNGSTALPFEFPDSPPLRGVLGHGIEADIIGLELYYSGVNQDGDAVVGLDLVSLSRALAHYADLDKPILIKEFSAPSIQVAGSSWWHRPWDEANQSDYVTKVYTLAFGTPSVSGISWSWGVSDADAFIRGGGLLDENFEPKPAYFALLELLDSWTTRGHTNADSEGRVAFRGFAGDYAIRVESVSGEPFETRLQLAEGETLRIELAAPASALRLANTGGEIQRAQ